jgi:hypothetical protein
MDTREFSFWSRRAEKRLMEKEARSLGDLRTAFAADQEGYQDRAMQLEYALKFMDRED